MYASRAQREAEIEVGAGRPAGELRNWLADSAAQLAEDLPGSPNPRGSPPFRPGDRAGAHPDRVGHRRRAAGLRHPLWRRVREREHGVTLLSTGKPCVAIARPHIKRCPTDGAWACRWRRAYVVSSHCCYGR